MRKHGTAYTVAHRENAFHASTALVIDFNKTAFVELNSRVVCEETCRIGSTTDGDDQLVDFKRCRRTVVLVIDCNATLAEF